MSITSTGFSLKRQDQYITELQSSFRSVFGVDIDVDTSNPDSVAGQLIAIFSERFALLYEMAQSLYDAGNPSNAAGVSLDNLALILGISRDEATPTKALVTLAGDIDLVVPAGQQYNTATGFVFTQDSDVTLDDSGAATNVAVTAVEPGAVGIPASTITTITTPLSGLSSVTNPAVATTGTDLETDTQLRLRMASASSVTGSTTVDAIRSRLLDVPSITNVQVIENATEATVASQPPHTIQCVVYPDQTDTDTLAKLIWDNKAAGIGTYGNQSAVSVVDTQGTDQDVYFSFATAVPVKATVTITYDSSYPSPASTGDDQLKQLVMDYVNTLGPGDDVQTFKITCALSSFTGVVSLTVLTKLSSAGGYDADNVAIAATEVARISALSDVTVTSSEA